MEIHFTRTNGDVDKAIDGLLGMACVHHHEIIREMIIAALKAGTEKNGNPELRLMNQTLKEMRFTSKVFSPYKNVKKVTVFGSARTMPDEPVYEMARLFGKKLAEAGYMVITGAGGGIMHAVNEGAGSERSFGVNILLPHEQKPNPVLAGNPRLITYKYFFNRKVAFVKEADAIALFPGGFGTLDEAMEILTLLQTGKHTPMPLVLIDEPGGTYWSKWLKFFREELLSGGYIGESDFYLIECVDSVYAAIGKIDRFYRRYHSIRYIRDKLAIRMKSSLDEHFVEQLKDHFRDILLPGGSIYLSGPLPEESDEPEIAHLPRLIIDFNRAEFSRLRRLIDLINNHIE